MSKARLTCTFSFKQAVRQSIATEATSGYNGASFLNVSNSSNIFSVAKKMFVYLAMRFIGTEDQTIGNLVCVRSQTFFGQDKRISVLTIDW